MKTATKVTSIAAACGAGALGLALIGMGTGVGAQFTDSAVANAHLAVGTFGCTLSSSDPSVAITNSGHTANVTLPTIESSAPGSESVPLTVKNSGSIPLVVNWTVTHSGKIFSSGRVTPLPIVSGYQLSTGATANYAIGAKWTELQNDDLGTSGMATYTASCVEPQNTNSNLRLFKDTNGATATFDNGNLVLGMPANDNGYAGAAVVNAPSTLPAAAPTFSTDNYNSGSPRFVISFGNTDTAFGYPSNAMQGSNNWDYNIGGVQKSGQTYTQVMTAAGAEAVTEVDVLMDGDQTTAASPPATVTQTDTISCINYGGSLLGSGTCS